MSDSYQRISLGQRQFGAYLVAIGILAILLFGLVRLQVVSHQEMTALSESNRVRVVPIVARRGLLLDREGRAIAGNRPSYTLSVVPAEEVKGKTVQNLSTLIGVDTSVVRNRMRRSMTNFYQPAMVRLDIPFDMVAVLEEQGHEYPGVTYTLDRTREYLPDVSAEAFTGYVDEVSEEELNKLDPGLYRLGSVIGKKGIEKQYDVELRGVEGTSYLEVFASGEVVGPYEARERVPSIAGRDLVLGIDLELQKACQDAFSDSGFSHCCGAIVAADPRTGEILAMSSFPEYDANIFAGFVTDSLWKGMTSDSTKPLLNRVLNGLYSPGSTAKLVTVGAGLEEGEIVATSTMRGCGGGLQIGNRFFRCWYEKGHGVLDAVGALEHSCNVYMYQLGLRLGAERLGDYYARCGFGTRTGIDIPGEFKGIAPTQAYYDKRYGEKKWSKSLVVNTAIGQGELLVTPLQLLQFYCGLANDGVVNQLHMVHEFRDVEHGRIAPAPTKVAYTLPFSKKTLSILKDALGKVVQGSGGTAQRLKNKYYTIGGKTGTAQNPHGEPHSWFVGMAPLEAPEIVVCAIVENAGHGSEVAAPAVAKVIEKYMFKKLGIVTDSTGQVAQVMKDAQLPRP